MKIVNRLKCKHALICALILLTGCETTSLRHDIQSNAKSLNAVLSEGENQTAAFEFSDIPSMMIFYSQDAKPATIEALKKQSNELDAIAPDEPSPDFFNYEASSGMLVYNNVGGKYVFDVDQQVRAGIIFSDGIKAPAYVFLNDDTTFLQEFIEYFSISSKPKFEKYIERRAEKRLSEAMRKSNAEQPIKTVINKVKTDYFPTVTADQAAKINKVMLNRFDSIYGYALNQEHFLGDFKNLHVEFVAGGWKGRTNSFKRNELGQRVTSQNIIYEGTNTTDNTISYGPNGLIKEIASSNYRSKLDSTSDTVYHFFWESDYRVLVYRFSTQPDRPVYWDDMKSVSVESFDFDTQYRPTKHEVYSFNGVTGDFTVSDFGWIWEYSSNEIIKTNLRDGNPFDRKISRYKNGFLSEVVIEGLGYDFYRKDVTDNAVTKSFSKENKLISLLERTVDSKGCVNEIVKSEESTVVEIIKFECD